MVWEASDHCFHLKNADGTLESFGDNAFKEAATHAGTYQTYQPPSQQPPSGSSSLHSLTRLSRRQEDRTGVSEKDLLEKYGLK